MVRQALTLYRALMRDLPSDSASVRQLTASRSRHVVMATALANEATLKGLGTPEGMKLAEASRSHDLAAQRLAITAFDLATKEALSKADRHGAADPLARWRTPTTVEGGSK